MDAVVTALALAPSQFFDMLAPLAPLIVTGLVVSFGLGILGGVVAGLNEGRAQLSMGHKARWDDGIDGIRSGKYHG